MDRIASIPRSAYKDNYHKEKTDGEMESVLLGVPRAPNLTPKVPRAVGYRCVINRGFSPEYSSPRVRVEVLLSYLHVTPLSCLLPAPLVAPVARLRQEVRPGRLSCRRSKRDVAEAN